MKKVVYSLKEIILGLREEYIENQKQLQDLKNYCSTNPFVSDYSFYMQQYSDNYQEYLIYLQYFLKLDEKESLFKPIQLLNYTSNIYMYPEFGKVLFDYGCPIRVSKAEQFLEKKDEIISSDFSKFITRNNMNAVDMPCTLSTNLNSITAYQYATYSNYNMRVLYDAQSDKLFFTLYCDMKVNEPWVKTQLESILNNTFYKSCMSNYMFESVARCDEDKEINLCDYSNGGYGRSFTFEFSDKKRSLKHKNTIF